MNIELSEEMVYEIVYKELSNTLESFESDLGAGNNIFFWLEHEKDDVEIQKHIDAIKLILDLYL